MRHFKTFCFGLGVALIFCAASGCGRSEKPVRVSKAKPRAPKADSAAASVLAQQDVASLLKAVSEKNPFRQDRAVNLVVKGSTDRSLKGIVWDSEKPYAIIGERVVRIGDYIGEKKVVDIQQGSVTLESAGQQEILYLD
ncbi:MAG: hypothetical protein V1863_02120 [Candidatus Omnitrophota bacterium]